MSAWRRKAVEAFPDLRREIESPKTSIYLLFFELLHRCRIAYEAVDNDEVLKICTFAEWCFRQKTGELSNAAAVAFYEHFADHAILLDMPKWVKPDIFWDILPLLEWRGDPDRVARVKAEYEGKFRPRCPAVPDA